MPTVVTYGAERDNLSKSNAGISIVNSVNGNTTVYVSDSSFLTAGDSSYLGINGWTGSYDGPSISKTISENVHSGSNDGDGTGGNGDGSGNGQGNGNGNGGSLDWGDIIGALGGNSGNIAVSGDGSGLSDWIDKILNGNGDSSSNSNNTNSNSQSNGTKTDSHNSIKVEGTSDIVAEDAGGLNDDGGPASSVGTSSSPLSGEATDSSADASDGSSSSPGESGASASSSKAYIIHKNETDSLIQKEVNDNNLMIIIILFLGLILLGYYRESRNEENRK